jgi:hypothetical protein
MEYDAGGKQESGPVNRQTAPFRRGRRSIHGEQEPRRTHGPGVTLPRRPIAMAGRQPGYRAHVEQVHSNRATWNGRPE